MITPENIAHLGKLARISLSPTDTEALVHEFDSILGYIDQLKKVDVSLDVSGRVGAVKNVMRPDIAVQSTSLTREALLNEAPHREGDFVAVKKMIEQ